MDVMEYGFKVFFNSFLKGNLNKNKLVVNFLLCL